MTLRLAIAIFLAIPLLASCFRPDLTCLPCRQACPGSLKCMGDGYCAESEDQARGCAAARDAAPSPPKDATETPPDQGDAFLCTERCCVGGRCLEFTTRLRDGLLLWADRTSLPNPGSPVETWTDRSGRGNHIRSVNFNLNPRVQQDAFGSIIEISDATHVLATKRGPELRFGVEDFTILVVARCDSSTRLGSLVDRIGGPGGMRTGISLFCNHTAGGLAPVQSTDANRAYFKIWHESLLKGFGEGVVASVDPYEAGQLHLYGARRAAAEMQLRVDGKLQGRTNILRSVDLDEESPTFIGAPGVLGTGAMPSTSFVGGMAAVIVVRGPLEDEELRLLESFVMET